jgi:hypothetical protein
MPARRQSARSDGLPWRLFPENRRRWQHETPGRSAGDCGRDCRAEPKCFRRIVEGNADSSRARRSVGLWGDLSDYALDVDRGIKLGTNDEGRADPQRAGQIVGNVNYGFADFGARDGDDGLAGRNNLADFGADCSNHAAKISLQLCIAELFASLGQTCLSADYGRQRGIPCLFGRLERGFGRGVSGKKRTFAIFRP